MLRGTNFKRLNPHSAKAVMPQAAMVVSDTSNLEVLTPKPAIPSSVSPHIYGYFVTSSMENGHSSLRDYDLSVPLESRTGLRQGLASKHL